MPKPSLLSVLGIAKEATPGTAAAPTGWLPFDTFTPQDQITYLDDKGVRGSLVDVYNKIAGPSWSTIDVAGNAYADTIGFILASILGDVTTTGATAPYSHAISTLNSGTGQPPTVTLTDNYQNAIRQYTNVMFSECDLSFGGDALLTHSSKAIGNPSATTAGPFTPSFSTVQANAAWKLTATIGGTAAGFVTDGQANIKRAVNAIHAADGTQAPYKIWGGAVSVDGKLNLVMEDDNQLLNFLNNSQPSLVLDLQQGAGATLTEIKLQMTKAAFTNAQIDRSKDYIGLAVDFSAIANTTDAGASAGYSPIKVTLQNALPSGTYK